MIIWSALSNASANEKHSSMVIRIDPTSTKGLCLTVDCNARYVHADPKKGGAIAVCEAARNIACSEANLLPLPIA